MTVSPGAILRVVPTFTIGAITKAQNVYHVTMDHASPQADGDVVDAAEELMALLMANFNATIHTTVSMTTVEVFEYFDGHWIPIGEVVGSWSGAGSGSDRMPSGCALLVDIYKERTGYNDRKYICGFMEGAQNGEEWSGSVLDDADDFIVDLLAPFTASNGVVLQCRHWNRVTHTTKDYTGGQGQARVAYQRRRKPGVGLS